MKTAGILFLILILVKTGEARANADTITDGRYMDIFIDYYSEDFLFDRTFQWSKIPVIASPGVMTGANYFYKQRKITADFLSLELGYCLHPQQYYKAMLGLQTGTRFKLKYGLYIDVLAGLSFHNSWPTNTAFDKPVNEDIRRILNRGYGKLYFEGSMDIGYKLKKIPLSFSARTDFFFSYPFAFDNFLNSLRLGVSYDLKTFP